MRFSVLASGSRGNALYIETKKTGILVDAGLSCRETLKRLEAVGADPGKVKALVVTHEHRDHVNGVGPVARRLGVPVVMNRLTYDRCASSLGNLSEAVFIQTGRSFAIGDLSVETFSKCHDASDPMGVVVSHRGFRLGVLTDLGRSTRLVENRLAGCRALVLEFNHDPDLLVNGPYPLFLKRRIQGPEGHLSNLQACDLLKGLLHEDLGVVVPAHLSGENNEPGLALEQAGQLLKSCGLGSTAVELSLQDRPTSFWDIC